jgi:excisionase family DNA binding protein
MTIRGVAQYLKLTEKTAYRLAAEGKLPSFKVGGAWRFLRGEIDKRMPSISCARPGTCAPSNAAERSPPGIRITCWISYGPYPANPDSLL